MRSDLRLLVSSVAFVAVAACTQLLTGTKCDKAEDCGGGLFCDLSQHRCVQTLPSLDAQLPAADSGSSLDAGAAPDAALSPDAATLPPDAAATPTDAAIPPDAAVIPPDAATPGPPINRDLCGGPPNDDADAGFWCTYKPKPTFGGSYLSVWGDSASNFWAVGENHTVVHWDGTTWNDLSANKFDDNGAGLTPAALGGVVGSSDAVYVGDSKGLLAHWSDQFQQFDVDYASGSAGQGYTCGFTSPDSQDGWLGGTASTGAPPRTILMHLNGGLAESWSGYITGQILAIAGGNSDDIFYITTTQFWHLKGGWIDTPMVTEYTNTALWVDGDTVFIGDVGGSTHKCTVTRSPLALNGCSTLHGDTAKPAALWGGGTGTLLELWAVSTIAITQGQLFVATGGSWTGFSSSVMGMRAIWGLSPGRVVAVGNGGQIFVHWR
jgi:hypothetical protein